MERSARDGRKVRFSRACSLSAMELRDEDPQHGEASPRLRRYRHKRTGRRVGCARFQSLAAHRIGGRGCSHHGARLSAQESRTSRAGGASRVAKGQLARGLGAISRSNEYKR